MSRSKFIAGLDLGSSSIKIVLAEKKPKEAELEILSQEKIASSGIRKGVIINPEQTAKNVSWLADRVQEESGCKIKNTYVNIGGTHLFCVSSQGLISVSRADQKISQEDINRVIQAAQTLSLPANKEILEVYPRQFIVDGERGIKEPLGMHGVRLEVEILALAGFSPYLKNLTKTVSSSGLQIQDLVSTCLASSRAVLTPREKELGVIMLDIGAGTSSLAVFEEGDLIYAAVIPIGSANITNDIAVGLRTDIDIAERIKLEMGFCVLQKTSKKEKIKEIAGEILAEPLSFSKKSLVGIIEARVKEIFGETKKELKKISRYGQLPAGIVLTGGGAKLPKIVEMAKKELKLPCRIGIPQGVFPQPEDPSMATVCGLALLAADDLNDGKNSFVPASDNKISSGLKKIFRIFMP